MNRFFDYRIVGALALFSLLTGAQEQGCGGGDSNKNPKGNATCARSECGAQPNIPTIECADGTLAGFTGRCREGDDGSCGWEIIEECPSGCDYLDRHFAEGATFWDGCNTCQCDENGQMYCTLAYCPVCWSDADCGEGFHCEEGASAEFAAPADDSSGAPQEDRMAPPAGFCVPDHEDCPDGFHCEQYYYADNEAGAPIVYDPCICVPNGGCLTDADCGDGYHCDQVATAEFAAPSGDDGSSGDPVAPPVEPPSDGVCVQNVCSSDEDCAEGYICFMRRVACIDDDCVPKTSICIPADDGCYSDDDCKSGTYCEGESVCPPGAACFVADTPGVCVPQTCASDEDCAAGSHCEGSSVCPPDVVCIWAGEPGVCVPDEPNVCYSSDQCSESEHCSTEDGVCSGPCAGLACLVVCSGTCVPDKPVVKCFSSEQCADGDYCSVEDGDCLSPCDDTAAVCIDVCAGICKARPSDCTPDECGPAPMAPNYLCDDGTTWAGPGDCKRSADGVCGWTWKECPSTTADCGDKTCTESQFCLAMIGGMADENGELAIAYSCINAESGNEPLSCDTLTWDVGWDTWCACDETTELVTLMCYAP